MTERTYRSKTDDEVAELAKRIYRNEVFVSWMVQEQHLLPMVFMVLNFMTEEMAEGMRANNIQFLYAEYNEAGPTSVNGYPCFYSCGMLDREDGERVHAKVRQIAELVG